MKRKDKQSSSSNSIWSKIRTNRVLSGRHKPRSIRKSKQNFTKTKQTENKTVSLADLGKISSLIMGGLTFAVLLSDWSFLQGFYGELNVPDLTYRQFIASPVHSNGVMSLIFLAFFIGVQLMVVTLGNIVAQKQGGRLLMRLLEETGVVENRGSGIPMMIAVMREAHLEPPQFRDTRASFRVVFKNHTLLDTESVAWLNQFAGYPLTDAQRMALVYLRVNPRMTNSDYRRLNNTSTVEATRELRDLVDLGLIEMHGTRRWAYYTLADGLKTRKEIEDGPEQSVLRYVARYGSITNQECRELLGWGADKRQITYRLLKRLVQEGKLQQEGKGRWTRYTAV